MNVDQQQQKVQPRRLSCRYCEWTTLAWFTTKNGNSHSGMDRLVEHVRDTHTPTYVLSEMLLLEEEEIKP